MNFGVHEMITNQLKTIRLNILYIKLPTSMYIDIGD